MSLEIQLIKQIQQFEYLYNYNLPEYNRKDLVDDAWGNVAMLTNLSVTECREKWRNIRSSYLRSMKPSTGSKVKRPYYLSKYLKFLLPYLKPINVESTTDSHYEISLSNEAGGTDDVENPLKIETEDYEEPADVNDENVRENDPLIDLLPRRCSIIRKRRRHIPIGNRIIKTRNRLERNDLLQKSSNSIEMFLMSMLPELENMREDQIRLFKIKSMQLIDDIKLNYPQLRQNHSTINSERLQKRLINLLLRNLQHKAPDE